MRKVWPQIKALLLIAGFLLVYSCQSHHSRYLNIEDDLEEYSNDEGRILSSKASLVFGSTKNIASNRSLSGNTSLVLNSDAPFALNYKLSKVRTNEYIRISVKYTGPGQLVIVAQENDPDVYYKKKDSKIVAGKEWALLEMGFHIPPTMDKKDLIMYVWNPGDGDVYVDDWTMTYTKEFEYPEFNPEESLHLYIDSLALLSLEAKRTDAFEKGILVSSDADYVEGIMFSNDSIMPVELRLKGDWLDHLEGKKWSFRIKIKGDFAWKGLKTFSIQNPESRDFLNEYVAHELYREADNLAPRYGFIPVTLNGKSLGVYAWEEHFDKQLVESMNRREGPILKFSEDHFWEIQKILAKSYRALAYPFLEASVIEPFKLSRTLADSVLKEKFLLGADLLYQFQYGLELPGDIFDLKHFASFHALMDLTRAYHGLTWHNLRFYFNPITNRLEPIFFDGYTEIGVFGDYRPPIAGWIEMNNDPLGFDELNWIHNFQDPEFVSAYISALRSHTSEQKIKDFFIRHGKKIDSFEKMIRKEFPNYRYDKSFIYNNAKRINEMIDDFENFSIDNPEFAQFDYESVALRPYNNEYNSEVLEHYCRAYSIGNSMDSSFLEVRNYIPRPIWVVGYGENQNSKMVELSAPVRLNKIVRLTPPTARIIVDREASVIFCLDDSSNQLFPVPIQPFRTPQMNNPRKELEDEYSLDFPDGVIVKDSTIVFGRMKYTINKPLLIPDGYRVTFENGCHVDMIDRAMIISYSPVLMAGSEDDPVTISSSDSSSMGFTVLQARERSYIKYANFLNLGSLSYKGWELTGAVNFFESPVEITGSHFESNFCEDALNTIRTDFVVSDSKFSKTFADAFDSDFCTGTVESVSFFDIGNDAIDFSGSVVNIRNCIVNRAGDKGVSCGEDSNLSVENTRVENANIGYASKDLSHLNLQDCQVFSTVYGLVAFQKKPEFGPGYIEARQFMVNKVDSLHLIELSSRLKLNGTIINGQAEKVAARFY
jgi:hypothetical protein